MPTRASTYTDFIDVDFEELELHCSDTDESAMLSGSATFRIQYDQGDVTACIDSIKCCGLFAGVDSKKLEAVIWPAGLKALTEKAEEAYRINVLEEAA